jgi:hypothetical protein
MSKATDPFLIRSELEALREEREALIAANERALREGEIQRRQLVAEQDRFVSHLIEAHERDVGRLKADLGEANANVARLERELAIAKTMLDDAISGPTPRSPGRFQSAEPVSGPHSTARSQRESGIVGRLAAPKVPTITRSSRR